MQHMLKDLFYADPVLVLPNGLAESSGATVLHEGR